MNIVTQETVPAWANDPKSVRYMAQHSNIAFWAPCPKCVTDCNVDKYTTRHIEMDAGLFATDCVKLHGLVWYRKA